MIHKSHVCAISILSAAATIASADSVNISFDGISANYGRGVDVALSGGLTFADGDPTKRVWAGQLSHTVNGESLKTFCTELTQWAHSGVYDIIEVAGAPATDPMGAGAAQAIYRLFNATNGGADIDSNDKGAAFQAVVWEIAYDFNIGLSLGAGRVQIGGVSNTWFNTFKQFAMDPQGDASPNTIAYTHEQWQDQLGPRPIPLPGTAAMGVVGLVTLGSRRRR